jgi:hypothetical protein
VRVFSEFLVKFFSLYAQKAHVDRIHYQGRKDMSGKKTGHVEPGISKIESLHLLLVLLCHPNSDESRHKRVLQTKLESKCWTIA